MIDWRSKYISSLFVMKSLLMIFSSITNMWPNFSPHFFSALQYFKCLEKWWHFLVFLYPCLSITVSNMFTNVFNSIYMSVRVYRCFQIVVLEKTLETARRSNQSILTKWNQPWIFIGRTYAKAEAPILWPPDVRTWLIGKDHMLGKIEAKGEGCGRGWDG